MALFLVVSTLSMIVVPKVRRAQSGEKIVMSKLLDPRQARRQSSVALPSKTNGIVAASTAIVGLEGAISASEQTAIVNNCVRVRNPIVLDIDDPPPRRIERAMFSFKDLISEFTQKSLEGRHIPLSLWQAIITAVSGLNGDLQSIEFTWDENDEIELSTSNSM